MNWKRHPDPEVRHRARRVAQLVLMADMRLELLAAHEDDEPTVLDLVRRKRAWFVTAAHSDAPWLELADMLGWGTHEGATGSPPSAETLQLARETIDAQCHILFRIDTAGMVAQIEGDPRAVRR